MSKKCLWLPLLTLTILPLFLLTGCSDDDDDPIAPVDVKPFVSAIISGYGGGFKADDPGMGSAIVTVTQFTTIPSVHVNGDALVMEPEISIYGGGMGFYGPLEMAEDNLASLVVGFGDGAATGTGSIVVAGHNEVVGDSEIDVVEYQDVDLTWTSAENAERYYLYAYFEVNYTDIDDNPQSWENHIGVAVTDTTFTLTADQMFPPQADVQTITYYYGDTDLTPINGPFVAGEATNITGACDGVLAAYGRNLDWDYNWNNGPVLNKDLTPETKPDWASIIDAEIQKLR